MYNLVDALLYSESTPVGKALFLLSEGEECLTLTNVRGGVLREVPKH